MTALDDMLLVDVARIRDDEAYKQTLRLRAQTDPMFLGRALLGYTKLLDRVHRPVAELCVKKHPDKPIEEWDTECKERMHLDPRGTFKSTWSIIDSVQAIVCCPNVRICKLTATKPLATAIVGEIGGHFVKRFEATAFQELFPEFCISPNDVKVATFTVPNRTREWREQTVMAFSNETSITGWHFDFFDPDDVVDPLNTRTPQMIAQVKKNYRINKKTLMPWGFINHKGTRYNVNDLHGDVIKKAIPGQTKLLVRSALQTKDGARLEFGHFPAPDEVTLLFPELLSYDFLKKEFVDDYDSFMSQYMNDTHGGKEIVFPREKLLEITLPAGDMPITGRVTMAWRFACDAKQGMRCSAGAVGVEHNNRMFIVDAVRGMFPPSALAAKIVQMARKHGTHDVLIEETPGAKSLAPTIQNYAMVQGWRLNVTWIEFEDDDSTRAGRIKALEPNIAIKRVLFSASIAHISEAYDQLENFGTVEDNELPDVFSRVAERLPKSLAVVDVDPQQELDWELARQRDQYDRTHGLGSYAPAEPIIEEQPAEPPKSGLSSFGLPEILGGLNG